MSKSRDKRLRMDLDLFLLALIESGISTPYDFQRASSLSPRETIPALQTLLESGSIRQAAPGARGKTDHRITPAGRKLLRAGWRDLLEEGPTGDLDADLRVALLTLWVGGDRRPSTDFLRASAIKKTALLEASDKSTEYASGSQLADWYAQLRSESGVALLKAESAAAFGLVEALPKRSSVKRKP